MPTFQEFANWLFPGDPVGPLQNPYIPEVVQPLLDEVAQCTNISPQWVENTAGLVIEGLAGLQCLWYLHGARGTIIEEKKRPSGETMDELDDLIDVASQVASQRATEKAGRPIRIQYGNENWGAGIIEETRIDYQDRSKDKVRVLKMGRWLKKWKADSLVAAFETRDLPSFEWEVSAHPYDILTMSHERPWTSCMRPGGEYQYGPLTDMAAGSALLFFYRPGAAKPCGRRILRPLVAVEDDFDPAIMDGGRTYGCGPADLRIEELRKMLAEASGVDMPVYREPFCPYGYQPGEALTRYIYSDTDHTECDQDDEDYAASYANLDSADWPPINLDFTTIGAVAENFRGLVEIEKIDEEEEFDVPELSSATVDEITGAKEINRIYDALQDPSILADWVSDFLVNTRMLMVPEHIEDDVYESVRYDLKQHLIDTLGEDNSLVFAIPPGSNHPELRTAQRDALVVLQDPDYAWSTAVQELGIEPDDEGAWHTYDGQEVHQVLIVSESFRHALPNSLWDLAVATAEIDDYDWEYEVYREVH